MHVTVLVPDIHDHPTGGNIYNRRTITELRRYGTVEVTSWNTDTDALPCFAPPDGSVVVVDSLLLQHDEALRALRSDHPTVTLVLLAHYLHCIDPNERTTSTAASERAVLPLFDAVVTTSQYAKQSLIDEGVSGPRITVVPPGLDESYRMPVLDQPNRETPRLLTVANLLPGKGLRMLVDVLTTLADTAWTWTLVGDDALDPAFANRLHERIRASSIADRVTCTGRIPPTKLRGQYDHADLFVLPSRFETCSMATREAMARGLPVVACAVGGLPDNFGKDVDLAPGDAVTPSGLSGGHLVPPGQPGRLKTALRSLLTDPAARSRMGNVARKQSQSFPTWTETGTRFHAALRARLR